ncbi:GTPase [Alistipes ihumii]|uniref:GTPase n=1 Tax=Alistipes ihumii TaxID=1470347 RepID=UPI00345BD239
MVGRPNVGKSTLFDRLVGMHAWFPYAVPGRAAWSVRCFRKASGAAERAGFLVKMRIFVLCGESHGLI